MCSSILSTNFFRQREPQVVEKPVEEKGPTTDKGLTKLMNEVIDQKSANVQKPLDDRVNVLEGLMIGGDAFSMGYLIFQGVLLAKPVLAAIPAVATATLVCGTIAGVINIAVAIICLKEGIQAWENGDKELTNRLIMSFVCYFAIGAIMVLASLALQLSALGGVSTFLVANPWLLPVLFFIASIPMIIELGKRIKNSVQGTDWGSQLKKNDLNELIQGCDEKNPFHLESLRKMLERNVHKAFVKEHLSQKMEILQADMGVEAAIETFKLLKEVLNKERYEEQLKKAKAKIAKWNRVQYVRLFQQALYTAAFGMSMGTVMCPRINIAAVNSTQSFVMGAANAVPLYMDIKWPFMRNAPIVVPKVEVEVS